METIAVLALVLAVTSVSAAGLLGLITVEIPTAFSWAGQAAPWARLGVAMVLTVWVMMHRDVEGD